MTTGFEDDEAFGISPTAEDEIDDVDSATAWKDPEENGRSTDTTDVQALVLEGKLTHEWELPYEGRQVVVVYDLFPVGRRLDIAKRTSGFDLETKRDLTDFFNVVHALRSVGKWTWGGSLQRKIEFVRQLSDPLFDLFVAQYKSAKLKELERHAKRRALLEKSTPDRR